MALGSGDTRGGNQRGTLNPTNGDRVYIRYATGARVRVTPTVACVAIERGEAQLVWRRRAPKMTAAKKK